MKKLQITAIIVVLTVVVVGASGIFLGSHLSQTEPTPTPHATSTPTPSPIQTATPFPSTSTSPNPSATPTTTPTGVAPTYTYQIINTYPHDTNAFTQGLVFHQGVLYESTGGYGNSYLRRVDISSGNVLQEFKLSNAFFGEGLALVNNSLIQLTWLEHTGFVYDKETFSLVGNFSYNTEGWGLTYDGTKLIMSDGSSTLYFMDPTTYAITGQITVKDGNKPVNYLNELEYVNGDVYANIFLEQKIAIFNPQTGQVKSWIDLSGIHQSSDLNSVLNGIAYDQQNDRLYITGKNWPNLYQIKIVQK
ncbi:MAG: glutaminyl-peptide cyclotransferase [Candidatus Bathyarchaeota archaeon]|nr:glutaminyl-peptide cyclotransferase [Candidatus Bathyarchaeota archaeon]